MSHEYRFAHEYYVDHSLKKTGRFQANSLADISVHTGARKLNIQIPGNKDNFAQN